MNTEAKPLTAAQGVFGAKFGNRQIINERPESMSFREYRRARREQNKVIKSVLGRRGVKMS